MSELAIQEVDAKPDLIYALVLDSCNHMLRSESIDDATRKLRTQLQADKKSRTSDVVAAIDLLDFGENNTL